MIKNTTSHVYCHVVMSICACASSTGYPERSGNVEDELKQLEKYFKPEIIAEYDQEKDPDKKTDSRNEIVNALIRATNIHFNHFQQRLYREGVGSAIATDWTVIGLNAAASITSSLNKTQTLSAISGGITGAKASFDKNAFFEETMPAILSQMLALRKATEFRSNVSELNRLIREEMEKRRASVTEQKKAQAQKKRQEQERAKTGYAKVQIKGSETFDKITVRLGENEKVLSAHECVVLFSEIPPGVHELSVVGETSGGKKTVADFVEVEGGQIIDKEMDLS